MNPTRPLDFEIDEITNSIIEAKTGKIFETEVLPVLIGEIQAGFWQFDWQKELKTKNRSVYKLITRSKPEKIEGLLCLEPQKGFIEMHLLESSPTNLGKQKEFAGVAGNLVAFACKISFEMGFDGYISFIAKSALIEHYQKTLKAEIISGQRMVIQELAALELVNAYFKN